MALPVSAGGNRLGFSSICLKLKSLVMILEALDVFINAVGNLFAVKWLLYSLDVLEFVTKKMRCLV